MIAHPIHALSPTHAPAGPFRRTLSNDVSPRSQELSGGDVV
jgi:hypothetical protein